MSKSVTLAQVAAVAGVSVMTVSNVVNDKPGASEATRRRVKKVMRTLGYTPNLAARSLKGSRTGAIGVVMMLDLANDYAMEILRGVADEIAEHEEDLLISVAHPRPGRDFEGTDVLSQGLVDGLILVAPRLGPLTLQHLAARKAPFLILDPQELDVAAPRVVADNYSGARAGTEHLIGLGHTDIACITGEVEFDSSAERRRGFTEAMTLAGLRVQEEWIRDCDFSISAGAAVTRSLLTAGSRRPTAIFAAADSIASGALQAAQEQGLRVPEDISIVGFDDLPLAARTDPPLTTVRQPLQEMGRLALQRIIAAVNGPALAAEAIVVPARLVLRASTAAPASAR